MAGIKAEVRKIYEKQGEKWHVQAYTDRLADKTVDAGLRERLVEAIEKTAEAGLVKKETAGRWAEKLREGVTVAGDMPKFAIQINSSGGLNINHRSRGAEQLAKYVEALKRIGLVEGVHFTVREPKDGERGLLYITVDGVRKLAELSVCAGDESTRLEADRWLKHLLSRAGESGGG